MSQFSRPIESSPSTLWVWPVLPSVLSSVTRTSILGWTSAPAAAAPLEPPGITCSAVGAESAAEETPERPEKEGPTSGTAILTVSTGAPSAYGVGDRVFHLKFGYGDVVGIDGNKLTVAFDKAGEKRVIDSYVEPA